MTFKPKFTITNQMANDLTEIVTVKGFLEAAILSEDWIMEMQNRALVLQNGELNMKDFVLLHPDTPKRTLQRDLKNLADKELVAMESATNQLIYKLTP
jgi:hypothetical protein